MKKFTKQISEIIVHCTATPVSRQLNVKDIATYHRQRGFEDIGYHYLIGLGGEVEKGRPSEMIGAHCLGHNDRSIGVAYVGGLDAAGNPADTRTEAQKRSLLELLVKLKLKYPLAKIHGHRDFAAKACPCFDAAKEYSKL